MKRRLTLHVSSPIAKRKVSAVTCASRSGHVGSGYSDGGRELQLAPLPEPDKDRLC